MSELQAPPSRGIPLVEERNGKLDLNHVWYKWFLDLVRFVNISGGTGGAVPAASFTGYTGTVALAKLSTLGSDGQLVVENGLIKSYTAPT
ncbi:MAG: hypothetical protein SFV24_19090 [Gemmatimonadales bacterium]|nr:hypothetical protein [Gemmatimonadales bacterium]